MDTGIGGEPVVAGLAGPAQLGLERLDLRQAELAGKDGAAVVPEIMIPLVSARREVEIVKAQVEQVAAAVEEMAAEMGLGDRVRVAVVLGDDIFERIDELAADRDAKGDPRRAILMSSGYLPELLGICDRIAVMTRGHLGPARQAGEWSEERLMQSATGQVSEDTKQQGMKDGE